MTDENGSGDTFEVEGGRFVMVAIWALDAAVSDGAFRLYCVLADYGNRSGRSWPTRKMLAERLEVSTDTVDRRVTELLEAKLLTKSSRRSETGDQTSNLWIFRVVTPRKSADRGRKDAATGGRVDAALTRTNYEQEADDRPPAEDGGRPLVDNPAVGVMRTAVEIMAEDAAALEADGGPSRLEDARAALAEAREVLASKRRHPSQLFDESENP